MVQVDGYTYAWTGNPTDSIRPKLMTLTSLEVTPTRSIFTLTAGGAELTVEWLSPVEPGNVQLQSIPFALLTVSVVAIDDKDHKVLLYGDVTGEWASGTSTDKITWSTSTSGPVRSWTCQLADQTVFTEHDAMAAWGSVSWELAMARTTRRQARLESTYEDAIFFLLTWAEYADQVVTYEGPVPKEVEAPKLEGLDLERLSARTVAFGSPAVTDGIEAVGEKLGEFRASIEFIQRQWTLAAAEPGGKRAMLDAKRVSYEAVATSIKSLIEQIKQELAA